MDDDGDLVNPGRHGAAQDPTHPGAQGGARATVDPDGQPRAAAQCLVEIGLQPTGELGDRPGAGEHLDGGAHQGAGPWAYRGEVELGLVWHVWAWGRVAGVGAEPYPVPRPAIGRRWGWFPGPWRGSGGCSSPWRGSGRADEGGRGGHHASSWSGARSSWPGWMRFGSAPITARFAACHRGQAAAIWASLGMPPRCSAAIDHSESPGRTTYRSAAASVLAAGSVPAPDSLPAPDSVLASGWLLSPDSLRVPGSVPAPDSPLAADSALAAAGSPTVVAPGPLPRAVAEEFAAADPVGGPGGADGGADVASGPAAAPGAVGSGAGGSLSVSVSSVLVRSEEHTSELQSRGHLV